MEHALRIDLRADLFPGPIRIDAAGCPSVTVSLLGLEHLEVLPVLSQRTADQAATAQPS